jgi:hypothetical protein
VQVYLAEQLMRQQPPLLVEHRHGALVAGGLDCQYPHGQWTVGIQGYRIPHPNFHRAVKAHYKTKS